jgi:predicted dehydrogenase
MENLQLLACADIIGERAEAKAAEFGIANVLTVEQLLADERIEIVLAGYPLDASDPYM